MARAVALPAAALLAVVGLAACGRAGPAVTTTAARTGAAGTTRRACATTAAERRRVARVPADLARLRRLARAGNEAALLGATNAFLLDVDYVAPRRRNRLIDYAVSAVVAGGCHACFEGLEAARPLPVIDNPQLVHGGCPP